MRAAAFLRDRWWILVVSASLMGVACGSSRSNVRREPREENAEWRVPREIASTRTPPPDGGHVDIPQHFVPPEADVVQDPGGHEMGPMGDQLPSSWGHPTGVW